MRNLLANGIQIGGGERIQGPGTIGEQVNQALQEGQGTGVVGVFTQQLSNIVGLITILSGLFFVIYFLIAGFDWVQAGGDTGKIEKSKSKMVNGAIGLLVVIIGMGIVGIIGGVFGLDLLRPDQVFLEMLGL